MSQGHLINPAAIPDDPFACPSRMASRRYRFTDADRRKGGQTRAKQSSFYQAQLKGRDTTVERHGRDALIRIVRRFQRRTAGFGREASS